MPKKRANGDGSLLPIRDKTTKKIIAWRTAVTIGYTTDGSPVRKFARAKTQEGALKRAEELKESRTDKPIHLSRPMTVYEFFHYWIDHKPRKLKPVTRADYQTIVTTYFLDSFGSLPLSDLTSEMLDSKYRSMLDGTHKPNDPRARPLSTSTVIHLHKVIGAMLKQAIKWKRIKENVALMASPPELESRAKTIWQPKQAVLFLESLASHRLSFLWRLALFTGMRRAELVGLQWKYVNLDKATLEVRETLVAIRNKFVHSENPKTATSARVINLTADCVAMFRVHQQAQELEKAAYFGSWAEPSLVFTTELGKRLDPSNLRREHRLLIKKAGVPMITLHELRHTFGSLLHARGGDLKVMAAQMGHTDVAFFINTYVKPLEGKTKKAAFGLEDLTRLADEEAMD
jgi:integrase